MAKPPHTKAEMRVFYLVFRWWELAAGWRDTTKQREGPCSHYAFRCCLLESMSCLISKRKIRCSPTPAPRHDARTPPSDRHLAPFLPQSGLSIPWQGGMGECPLQWPSHWRPLEAVP